MDRLLKFRGWFEYASKWEYFTLTDLFEDTDSYYSGMDNITQFTGLRDKNGTEIYEGDIVVSEYSCSHLGEKGIVTFNTNNFAGIPAFHLCDEKGESCQYYYGMCADDQCEIIGNVYENPELITGEQP